MSLALVAVIAVVWAAIGVFVLGLCRAAAKPVPPAHPKARRSEINLDDIDWDWKRAA